MLGRITGSTVTFVNYRFAERGNAMFMNRAWSVFLATAGLAIAGCVTYPQFPAGAPCQTELLVVTDQFHGARRGNCTVLAENHVRLAILPETPPPINDSPWYAFRIDPVKAAAVRITLGYQDGHHRYVPKVSYDNQLWQAIDEQAVQISADGREATFAINLRDQPVFVAAQELITPSVYDAWLDGVAARPFVARSLLGRSLNGLPIERLDVSRAASDVLLIVGRQHPPEVSGAFAFMSFADTLFGDSESAARFRERFRIIAIPLLNPDGVVAGNWRNNLGGVDLNRDWGPFTQPETQLIRDLLSEIDSQGANIRAFLDFHSTKRNVFFTQNDDFETNPPGFYAQWLKQSAARMTGYEFSNDENPVSAQANSKNYMYRRYGIPTATYEVGDESDRRATREAAAIFAEELMKLLMQQDFTK